MLSQGLATALTSLKTPVALLSWQTDCRDEIRSRMPRPGAVVGWGALRLQNGEESTTPALANILYAVGALTFESKDTSRRPHVGSALTLFRWMLLASWRNLCC